MPIISGNVGAVGPPAGSYVPVADTTGVTVDTTTYNDSIKGSGKLTTLVFPSDQGALAIAISGDAFPRWILAADGTDGLYIGDGVHDAVNDGTAIAAQTSGTGVILAAGNRLAVRAASAPNDAPALNQLSPRFTITSGALATVQLVSGAGAQISTLRDTETYTPLTLTNVAGSVVVALSPDNVTYTTLMTVTPAVNASVTDVTVRVPGGWYLQMTATNATIGPTTYY